MRSPWFYLFEQNEYIPNNLTYLSKSNDHNILLTAQDSEQILTFNFQVLIVEDDVASVMGTKIMVDYTGATMNHLVQASPSMIKKMMAVSQVRK